MLSRRTVYSAMLALLSLLGLTQLLDALDVWYFPMIHGRAYSLKFDLGFSLVPILLPLSAVVLGCLFKGKKIRGVLISVAASLCLYWILGFQASMALLSLLLTATSLYQLGNIGEYMTWTLYFLTGFEGAALSHWMLLPFGFHSPFVGVAELELALFYVFAPLAPLIMLFTFLIAVLKLIAPKKVLFFGQISKSFINSSTGPEKGKINLHPWILLTISLIVSFVGAIYPYSPNINPEGEVFGVDVHYYLEWMAPVERDPFSAFNVANGSRPIVLLLIYGIQRGLGIGVLEVVKYLPVLLNPLLVSSVFFMVSQATEDLEWASLASLFSASGFTITVGMYSYFLTNMLGLTLMFLAIGFLFKATQTGRWSNLLLASMLASFAIFTHPWTFAQYYITTALLQAYKYLRERRFSKPNYILTYLVITGSMDILKGAIGGLEVYGAFASKAPEISEITRFWSNNIFAFRQMYGGLLSNIVLLGIALFGVYFLDIQKLLHLFLTLLLSASSVYNLMVDGSAQTKLLYNIPFGILAALGMLFIIRNNNFKKIDKLFVLLFSIIYMIVHLLCSLANFL